MQAAVKACLGSMEFGDLQAAHNMAVLPLFSEAKKGRRFRVLAEALEDGALTVTEVDAGGSVPELKVRNRGDTAVLVLDGEELAGAKQNRVLNTTILVEKHAEIIVPVSCTERGRWSYTSRAFSGSGHLMAPGQRMRKSRSVSDSLRHSGAFRSDQGEVWDDIREASEKADVQSPTGAMSDVFEAREDDIARYVDSFPWVDRQRGLFVFLNGKVAGFEVLAREQAYRQLHQKLVASYAMQGILRNQKHPAEPSPDRASAFVKDALNCEEEEFESPGLGCDHRYRNERTVGSALVYWKAVVHAAFFRAEDRRDRTKLRGYRSRRSFRQ